MTREERERCIVCDRPEATDEEWETVQPGDHADLCWGEPTCSEHRVEWRERALAAEKALEEREGDMHARIRAGYDSTVADAWRAKVAEVEAEAASLRALLTSARRVATLAVRCHLSPSDSVRARGFREAMAAVDGWEVE
jgi:hypothetical protein